MPKEFNPYDPSSWSDDESPDPEARERCDEAIATILANFEKTNKLRNLRNYLASYEFDERDEIENDPDLKELISWLTSNDGLREKAVDAISLHLNTVQCPKCRSKFTESELIRQLPFDWSILES